MNYTITPEQNNTFNEAILNQVLFDLIKNASSHSIVKLMYHCENTKDYSIYNQIEYLQNYNK